MDKLIIDIEYKDGFYFIPEFIFYYLKEGRLNSMPDNTKKVGLFLDDFKKLVFNYRENTNKDIEIYLNRNSLMSQEENDKILSELANELNNHNDKQVIKVSSSL